MIGLYFMKLRPPIPKRIDTLCPYTTHCRANLAMFRPSRRAVGGDIAGFACPDDRHEDGGGDGKNTAGRGNGRAFHENRGCISVEGEPPPEEGGRIVERPSGQIEPRRTKLGLEAAAKGHPLRRSAERSGGKECDSTVKTGGEAAH